MSSSTSSDLVRVRPFLGTLVKIRAGEAPRRVLMTAVDHAFARVAAVHRLMSFHDDASELSIVNRDAFRRDVAVSPDTWAVLSLARQIHALSEGLFDAAVAPHLVRWGFLPGPAKEIGTLSNVVLHAGGAVRFERPMQLDLGGIAKGYAVDCAVDALRTAGAARGSVDAGGDLRVFGDVTTRVHVRHPRNPQRCVPLAELRDAAAATSATYFSRRRVAGVETSAIVDPRHATPCRTRSSVSVIAGSCAVADALTKVVLLDEHRAASILQRFGAAAVVIAASGRTKTFDSHAE